MSEEKRYTPTEYMICICARMIEDGKTVFIGYGMPQLAAILAQKLYAPNMCQVYEFGAIGPRVATPFVRFAMADSRNSYKSVSWTTMNPSGFRSCFHSRSPLLKPIAYIEPSAQMISKLSSGNFISKIEHFMALTLFDTPAFSIFLESMFRLSSSMSRPVISPLLSLASSIVGMPEPQPISRIRGLSILGSIRKIK